MGHCSWGNDEPGYSEPEVFGRAFKLRCAVILNLPAESVRRAVRVHMASEEESPVEKELALLKRRWGDDLEVLGVQYGDESDTAACFSVNMPLSDPDFQKGGGGKHDIGGYLKMTITLPPGYPLSKPCEVVVTNDNLNQQVRGALGRAIAVEANGLVGKIMVRDILKFVDNNLGMLLDCALEVLSGAARKYPADVKAAAPAGSPGKVDSGEVKAWTAEQQKALEAAIKEFPATIEAGERW